MGKGGWQEEEEGVLGRWKKAAHGNRKRTEIEVDGKRKRSEIVEVKRGNGGSQRK